MMVVNSWLAASLFVRPAVESSLLQITSQQSLGIATCLSKCWKWGSKLLSYTDECATVLLGKQCVTFSFSQNISFRMQLWEIHPGALILNLLGKQYSESWAKSKKKKKILKRYIWENCLSFDKTQIVNTRTLLSKPAFLGGNLLK